MTTVAACAVTGAATGSPALMAGVALGGFFIDVDHAVDYVLFERQRDLRPGAFLRYYVKGRARHLVLALHSYELFALLGVLAWWTGAPWLVGYLIGGLMHLGLDIIFNGQLTPRNIWALYSFTYRARHRFSTAVLFGEVSAPPAPSPFWSDFFGRRPIRRVDSPAMPGQSSWPAAKPRSAAPVGALAEGRPRAGAVARLEALHDGGR